MFYIVSIWCAICKTPTLTYGNALLEDKQLDPGSSHLSVFIVNSNMQSFATGNDHRWQIQPSNRTDSPISNYTPRMHLFITDLSCLPALLCITAAQCRVHLQYLGFAGLTWHKCLQHIKNQVEKPYIYNVSTINTNLLALNVFTET